MLTKLLTNIQNINHNEPSMLREEERERKNFMFLFSATDIVVTSSLSLSVSLFLIWCRCHCIQAFTLNIDWIYISWSLCSRHISCVDYLSTFAKHKFAKQKSSKEQKKNTTVLRQTKMFVVDNDSASRGIRGKNLYDVSCTRPIATEEKKDVVLYNLRTYTCTYKHVNQWSWLPIYKMRERERGRKKVQYATDVYIKQVLEWLILFSLAPSAHFFFF